MTLGASFVFFIILCSCGINKIYPKIESRYLPDNAIQNIKLTKSVAITNSSIGKEETRLCGLNKREWWGKLYDITETSISITKNALQRKNIIIDDKADKMLALSVDRFTCQPGWNDTTITSTLKVKTGNGLEKEYTASEKNSTGWQMTMGFELAMTHCVEQMLNDKEILGYLEH